MDVKITDTFTESLKRLIMHQTWWYKTYDAIRYDIPNFFKNVWKFRKELYKHRWWDSIFTLEMLHRSISIMEKDMSTKGLEVRESRDPKVKQMRRAIELLKHKIDDDYIDRAELVLGEMNKTPFEFEPTEDGLFRLVDNETPEAREHMHKVFQYARELEDKEWNELWDIFKGTENSKSYGENYDGTDMRGWWD
jgi:hypothetical protein